MWITFTCIQTTKHLELLKHKDEAESSFIIEKIVGKLLNKTLDLFHFIYPLKDSNRWEFYLHSDPGIKLMFSMQ